MQVKLTQIDHNQTFEDIVQIILPAGSGEIELLENHAELFTLLRKGELFLKTSTDLPTKIEIEGGTAHFKDNVLTVVL